MLAIPVESYSRLIIIFHETREPQATVRNLDFGQSEARSCEDHARPDEAE